MKKKNKITDFQIGTLIEEFGYLVLNKEFQKAVKTLRKEDGITIPPRMKIVNDQRMLDISQATKLRLSEEVRKLATRCRLYKSKYRSQFLTMLGGYILTDRYQNSYYSSRLELPRLQILDENGRPVVKISLDLDTSKNEIKDVIDNGWIYIKKAQKKLQGSKLDISPYNNKLGFEATNGVTQTPTTLNSTISYSVENGVDKYKGGNVTFSLVSNGTDQARFYSREAASSNRPQLVIEYQ